VGPLGGDRSGCTNRAWATGLWRETSIVRGRRGRDTEWLPLVKDTEPGSLFDEQDTELRGMPRLLEPTFYIFFLNFS
jgi:hypothetical protein